jgi:hypothetical protein
MNFACSAGLSGNTPRNSVVIVDAPCLKTPRMDMHMCSASSMTAMPRGARLLSRGAQICGSCHGKADDLGFPTVG